MSIFRTETSLTRFLGKPDPIPLMPFLKARHERRGDAALEKPLAAMAEGLVPNTMDWAARFGTEAPILVSGTDVKDGRRLVTESELAGRDA